MTPIGEGFGAVLDAARAGSDQAWAAIYRDLAPTVIGYVRARGASDPEGLCGDVFVRVVRDLPKFEGDESGFRSWVFVIAHHRLVDESRRRGRRREFLREAVPDQADPADVEAETLTRLGTDVVRRLIERLPVAQREVLLLRVIGGLSGEETARAVGRSPGAVRALQRRALEGLRRRMDDEGVRF